MTEDNIIKLIQFVAEELNYKLSIEDAESILYDFEQDIPE